MYALRLFCKLARPHNYVWADASASGLASSGESQETAGPRARNIGHFWACILAAWARVSPVAAAYPWKMQALQCVSHRHYHRRVPSRCSTRISTPWSRSLPLPPLDAIIDVQLTPSCSPASILPLPFQVVPPSLNTLRKSMDLTVSDLQYSTGRTSPPLPPLACSMGHRA